MFLFVFCFVGMVWGRVCFFVVVVLGDFVLFFFVGCLVLSVSGLVLRCLLVFVFFDSSMVFCFFT